MLFSWMSRKKKPKVLVIEDDQSLQPALFRLIQKISSQCEVKWVTKGSQALAELSKHDFDLVISDIFLAGSINGFDIVSKEKRLAKQGKFILISGQSRAALDQCLPNGSKMVHLEKPLKMNELGLRVKEILAETIRP